MAVTWIAEAAATASAGGDPVVTKPTGTAQFDLMLAMGVTTGAQTITPPAGWNTHPQSNSTARPLYWKLAGGSEPANYTFVTSGAANCLVVISTYRGVDQTSPFAGTAGFISTSSLAMTISAATPSIACYLAQMVVKLSVCTFTPPATVGTDDWDHSPTAVGSTAGGDELVAAGSTGTRVWTASIGAAQGAGYSVPLRPAITTLAVTGFDIAVQFGTTTLAQEQTLSATGFDVAVQFGTPTLVQDQAVTPAGFDLAVQYGTPSLLQEQVVSPAGFDVDVEYGEPDLLQHVAPGGFDVDVEYGTPSLTQGQIIEPDGFDVAVEYGAPALVFDQAVEPDGFDLSVSFGTPTLLQEQIVAPDGFDLDVEFGSPEALLRVAPDGFDLTVEFGDPTLAFDAAVHPVGFDLDVEFGTPSLNFQPLVTGTVFNHETGVHVGAGVEVKLFDDNDLLIATTVTDVNGVFAFARPIGDTDLYWTLATYSIGPIQYHGVSDRGCPAV